MRSSRESGARDELRGAESSSLPLAVVVVLRWDRVFESLCDSLVPELPIALVVGSAGVPCASGRWPQVEVNDAVPLVAGRVHLAAPGHRLVLQQQQLRAQPLQPRVDDEPAASAALLRALAEQFAQRGVAVLHGTDQRDCLSGLRALGEAGGLVLVLDESAASDTPHPVPPAIEQRIAPAALPAALRTRCAWLATHADSPIDDDSLEEILQLLRTHTGHDFSGYKHSSLNRRIERRIGVHQLDAATDYVALLRENPREVGLLFKELLIGVTRFFRDGEAWQVFEQQVLPALLASHPADQPLRAWIAGCSTGEEAYSLAIVLHEAIGQLPPAERPPLQVFATDLDPDAIERARAGWYPASVAGDIPAARLARHFEAERGGYRIARTVRETVVFSSHNVFMDPPFTRLELLVCRNLLIYLRPELQQRLFPLFHFCLRPNGVLFLGSAETVGRGSALFDVVDERARLYRRIAAVERRGVDDFPAVLPRARRTPEPVAANLQQRVEHHLLQRFTPPAVLVNAQGDILFVNGRTGRYLEPAAGRANWNVFAMARKRIGQELALLLPRALREKQRLDSTGIELDDVEPACRVDLCVVAIDEPEALHGTALVLFCEPRDAPGAAAATDTAGSVLQRELERAREALMSSRDDMQSQQEQLKAANEELQSANEELQSSNEELMTSKREMQALNHELQAVNQQLQARLAELGQANSDVENLVDSIGLAAVFVDGRLRVRRFSWQAQQLFRLGGSEIGRPLLEVASELDYPQLADDADQVLRSLDASERLVSARDGTRFRARITPYRTSSRGVDGLLLAFLPVARGVLAGDVAGASR